MAETTLKKRTLDWVQGLEAGNGSVFPIVASSPFRTLEATCFGIFVYELFGALDSVPEERRGEWREFILACQDAQTGIFYDPLLRHADVAAPYDWEYVTWQMTFFALGALDALGAKPRYRTTFRDLLKTPSAVGERLDGGNWTEPWGESNRVMFLLTFLLNEGAVDLAHCVLNWLDAHQDPETGFWGTQHGATLREGMAAAFHFYSYYFYLDRPVHHAQAIIDHTLQLQEPDGLYTAGGGGGACADLDAVDTLVKFSLLTDYRAEDIKASLSRSYSAILANQRPSGAFCEAVRPPTPKSVKRRVGEALLLDKLFRKPYRPYVAEVCRGWEKTRYLCNEGDLWSTWFRPLALALVSTRYPGEFIDDISWAFRRAPGLGWHDSAHLRKIRDGVCT